MARARSGDWGVAVGLGGASSSEGGVLVLSSVLMASLAFAWVGTYAVLGLWWSAAIPFVYQLASGVSIALV